MSHFLGPEHLLPGTKCLSCGYELDASSGFSHKKTPQPGNATLCIKCGRLMIFKEDLTLRNPTDDEMEHWAGHPELLAASKALYRLHKEIKG